MMIRTSWALRATCALLVTGCSAPDESVATNDFCTLAAGRRLGLNRAVCFTVHDGRAMVDGDIDLGDAAELFDDSAVLEGTLEPEGISPSRESAVTFWPGGNIPYQIASTFTAPQKQTIESAIAHFNSYSSYTGVNWYKKSQWSLTYNYVYIRPDPNPASVTHGSSAIGRAGGVQYLTLNFQNMALHDKNPTGTILHEMGHATGLVHEQQREDRDQYVLIHPQNIDPQFAGNYDKLTGWAWDDIGPYDFSSVMHYAWDNGSIQYDVLPTITKKDGGLYQSGTEIGLLSPGDVDAIQYLYRSALNPSLPFTDNFSRPDDIVLGTYWRNRAGKIDLEDGKASNASLSYWSVEQLGKKVYGSIKLQADLEVGEYGAYLIARYQDSGNLYYAGISRSGAGGSPRATLRKRVGGTYTELAGIDMSAQSGLFRFEVSSNKLTLYLNNQFLFTVTDSSFWSGAVGMMLAGTAKLDNFMAWQ